METLSRIRSEVGTRLMRFAQPDIIGICLALASLEFSHHKKIHLIESVVRSIRKLKGLNVIVVLF